MVAKPFTRVVLDRTRFLRSFSVGTCPPEKQDFNTININLHGVTMTKLKHGNAASLMMLLWLAIIFFFPERWGDFRTIIACSVPMLIFGSKIRGKTFGTRDCNTVIYKRNEYVLFFVFCICGAALISAITFLTVKAFGTAVQSSMPRTDFLYLFVFSCLIPAFFEEWLVRGGVLGILAGHGGAGIVICAVLFALMHTDVTKLPYALFSGLFITALVYLTECIYLGMLLHFLNNLTSLALSYLPSGLWEYIALFVFAVSFLVCAKAFKETKLCKDTVKLLYSADREKIKELCTPLFFVFAVATFVLMIWVIL